MKKLYLHLGAAKTGTTPIQKTLLANVENLSRSGICYVPCGHKSNNILATLIRPKSKWPRAYASVEEMRAVLCQARGHLDDVRAGMERHHTTIVSGEALLRVIPHRKGKGLIDLLLGSTRKDFDITSIIDFRDPASSYLSTIQQALRYSSVFKDPRDYRQPYEKWVDRWASDGLTGVVRLFDGTVLKAGNVVDDFLFSVGLDDGVLERRDDDHNISHSAEGMVVLQHLMLMLRYLGERDHEVTQAKFTVRQELSSVERQFQEITGRPVLKDDVRTYLLHANRKGIEYLCSRNSDFCAIMSQEWASRRPSRLPDSISTADVATLLDGVDIGVSKDMLERTLDGIEGLLPSLGARLRKECIAF